MVIRLAENPNYIIKEVATYTFEEFMADVGGSAGLILGLNLVSIIRYISKRSHSGARKIQSSYRRGSQLIRKYRTRSTSSANTDITILSTPPRYRSPCPPIYLPEIPENNLRGMVANREVIDAYRMLDRVRTVSTGNAYYEDNAAQNKQSSRRRRTHSEPTSTGTSDRKRSIL